ncbi:MAG TPA: CAP domain-containing protein [Jatrophihabitans sp.]|jgi:uncharacterized protein YkwD|nr:CAP domain-containing protein [Jatrophihabitans sp.]
MASRAALPALLAHLVEAASLLRRRLTSALGVLALAAALLVAPQLAASASAITYNSVTASTFAARMLSLMNSERRNLGRAPLRSNKLLIQSAHQHNLAMASANTMSHQLPREANFAVRISRTGYRWYWAGENIGWNSDMSLTGLFALQVEMFNERPPGEVGHRLNILNRNFRDVGIDVYFDLRHHKVWFTQDFGQAR